MREYLKWTELDKVCKDFGLNVPKKKKVDKSDKINKFCKCHKCGGTMKRINGTNVLICENKVEKEITNENGEKSVKTVNCGNTHYVNKDYLDYMNYLFS